MLGEAIVEQSPETLDELGLRFGTDKSSSLHDYLAIYERYLAALRDRPIRLLEIGILNGASLAVWEAYFPQGAIIGADIDKSTRRFARARVDIEILDQSNIESLVRLGRNHGPFDVIIEDGSHFWEHQITTLKTLFPFVKTGGIYIVEDLQTNFGAMAAQYRGVSSLSCVEYLKRLVDLRVADVNIDIKQEEDAFLRTYGRALQTITFLRRACILEKGPSETTEPETSEPYVQTAHDPAAIAVSLLAHVGAKGDITSPIGCVRSLKARHAFQGFAITPPNDLPCDIQYRARTANGGWTDWAQSGAFVGTRGKSASLTGFAIRLGAASRGRFTLEAIGGFAGGEGQVKAGDAQDCVSPGGKGVLLGMQVILRRA
jgi:hypothetical protein